MLCLIDSGQLVRGLLIGLVSTTIFLFFCSVCFSQKVLDRTSSPEIPQLGEYWQVTQAIHQVPQETSDLAGWRIGEPTGDLDKWYKPNDLGMADPRYALVILSVKRANQMPLSQVEVSGRLIMPSGKVFAFEKGIYSIDSRVLKFTTVWRDGVIFDGKAQFFGWQSSADESYRKGRLSLLASSQAGSSISVEFPIEYR